MDKMREDFEKWAASEGWGHDHTMIYELWLAWQASRQALEVELPESFEMDDFEAYDAPDVIEAIRAAGIKVKEDL